VGGAGFWDLREAGHEKNYGFKGWSKEKVLGLKGGH